MVKLDVKEIICNDEMLLATKELHEVVRGVLPRFSNYPDYAFGYASAERTLLEQFNVNTLSAYSVAGKKLAISATGALILYLKETQMHALKNIDTVRYLQNERFMQLDTTAVRNLEIIKTLGESNKFGSLLWLLDKTATAMGARMLHSAVLNPLYDKEAINYRLDGVEELFDATVVRLGIAELLKEVKDVERIAGKISGGTVQPRDCLALSRSLSVIPNIKFNLSGFNSKIINDVVSGLFEMSDVVSLIESAISQTPPANMKDGGYIKDGYNKQLDELRNVRKNSKQVILDIESRERDKTGIKNLRISYNRVFGYYIEVTKSMIDKVPLNYQRRQTLTNAERFTTDELKSLEEKILTCGELV